MSAEYSTSSAYVVTECEYQQVSPPTAKMDSRMPLRMAADTHGIVSSGIFETARHRRGSRDRGIPRTTFHIGDASRADRLASGGAQVRST